MFISIQTTLGNSECTDKTGMRIFSFFSQVIDTLHTKRFFLPVHNPSSLQFKVVIDLLYWYRFLGFRLAYLPISSNYLPGKL